jgi:antitoxin MazE
MEFTMQVSKWGNSLAVRLPRKLVEQMKLAPGDELNIVQVDARDIAIEKIDRRRAALERLSQMNLKLPEGYTFNREEANER